MTNFWLEQYWPSPKRDVSNLYMWFHDKKMEKDNKISDGDRVVFYEVGNHPDKPFKGAKTIFASGTVQAKREYIPKSEQIDGGKRWIFKRLVQVDIAVPPSSGIPLMGCKKLLGFKAWPQTGFQIHEKSTFDKIEAELWNCQQQVNAMKRSTKTVNNPPPKTPFTPKDLRTINQSGKSTNPEERLAQLEKSHNAHKRLLNHLANILKQKGFETSENNQVDLFSIVGNTEWIFEVKSAHNDNFLAQIRHGIAQLYEYRYKYKTNKRDVELCLVMQLPPPNGLEWVVKYLLGDRGIHLCWPVPDRFQSEGDEALRFLTT